MKPRQRPRRKTPVERLTMALRVAAAQIDCEAARIYAQNEATNIPPLFSEQLGIGVKCDIAKRARALLRRLPEVESGEWPDARATLRGYADILANPQANVVTDDVRTPRHRLLSRSGSG